MWVTGVVFGVLFENVPQIIVQTVVMNKLPDETSITFNHQWNSTNIYPLEHLSPLVSSGFFKVLKKSPKKNSKKPPKKLKPQNSPDLASRRIKTPKQT